VNELQEVVVASWRLEALRRLRDRGADTCVVYAVERSDHSAPLALYTSLGFEPRARHVRYER